MTDAKIIYRAGYDYQLAEDYHIETSIKPITDENVDLQFIALDTQGNLTVKSGYAWDGATGIIDTDNNLRASLVHDALYQLMREGKVSADLYKDDADELFKKICKKDGVFSPLAEVYHFALDKLANYATEPTEARKPREAP